MRGRLMVAIKRPSYGSFPLRHAIPYSRNARSPCRVSADMPAVRAVSQCASVGSQSTAG